ncbi:MAG: lipid droplet-associated protein [Actinomycetota bacterium]|nr:lipid droplet-associated protein [Actinomycetota bacterium]
MSPYPDEREVPDPPGRSVEIPEPIRAAAGLAAAMLDQARHLPSTITGLPVRMAGLAMQASLRLQQRYAGLVVKGDELLTQISGTAEADPPWATFDDDVVGVADAVTEGFGVDVTAASNEVLPALPGTARARPKRTPGSATRMGHAPSAFDLTDDVPAGTPAGGAGNGRPASGPPVPGYDAFTLAQLRARLRTFDAATLHDLLTYERVSQARAPYLTMLENRVTMLQKRATASRGQA